jgi:glutamate synthase (NADPH/NADH) small chain
MEEEGVQFRTGIDVGVDIAGEELRKQFDAIVLAGGSTVPRDLNVPGRELDGIHFAMDFLPQQNRRVAGLWQDKKQITAAGKRVVIIGGGDTGADCLGTVHRHGAVEVTQFEILPMPPSDRDETMPWPHYPMILRTSAAHEEGGQRDWSVSTRSFSGENGSVKKLHGVRVGWSQPDEQGRRKMEEIPGSDFEIEADLVLLAMGFLHPQKEGLIEQLGVGLDARGNVKTDHTYGTDVPGIYACGDMRRGQSLIVWAIAEGREAARGVDTYLTGKSLLPLTRAV